MFSLVLPTYNEAKNLPILLPKIKEALKDVPHEIIIVDDDSSDETWRIALELTKNDESVHVIRRIGRRGLSSAIMEGFLAGKGDVLGVMDADGQHDIALLPKLYAATKNDADITIGSRYITGGSVGEWDERRHMMSRIATRLAKSLCRVKTEDPMSGFFAMKRELFETVLPSLNPKGFKMLLDILVHTPRTTIAKEIPFTFGIRTEGESKLSRRVQIEFIEYLYDVLLGKYIPLVFVKYCLVGFLGVFVHTGAYYLFSWFIRNGATELTTERFSISIIFAVETAILFNFILNNEWTFARDRLRGMRAVTGFIKYNFACIFGALANLAVSTFLFSHGFLEIASVIIGAFAGVVWNYTMSRLITWKK